MKFICENCKTKYQIADEKAAGKTVRMKCRKCGNAIEVRAAVTETSASRIDPEIATATVLSEPPPAVSAPTPTDPPPRASAPPQRPSGSGAASPPRPPPPRPPPPKRPTPTIDRPPSALANAFQMSVHRDEEVSASMDLAELSAADQWYVAIGGVPVGPVPIAEVRQRAAAGAVTLESLCWQEGLEEWRPVRAFAELANVVREAGESGRTSVITTSDSYMGKSPAPPAAGAPRVAPPPRAPLQSAPRAAATTAPIGPLAQMAPLEDAGEDPTVAFSGALPNFGPKVAAAVVADPFAAHAPVAPAPSYASAGKLSESPTVGIRSFKEPLPIIKIGVLLFVVAFGVAAGVAAVLFRSPPPPQVILTTPAPAAPVAPSPAAALAPAAPAAEMVISDPTVVLAPVVQKATPSSGTRSAAPAAPAIALDLKSLKSGGNVNVGEDPGASSHASGQCISEGQIRQVMAQHDISIKRTCWERNPSSKLFVKVAVSVTVGGNGNTEAVSASGDDSTVAKCIERDVRTWRFPPMGCSQPIAFTYNLARQ